MRTTQGVLYIKNAVVAPDRPVTWRYWVAMAAVDNLLPAIAAGTVDVTATSGSSARIVSAALGYL